jgi:hypothetical protein
MFRMMQSTITRPWPAKACTKLHFIHNSTGKLLGE